MVENTTPDAIVHSDEAAANAGLPREHETLRHIARRTGARYQGLRLRDGSLIVELVRGRRSAMFRVPDGAALHPARNGLAIAARTDGPARGGRGRLERLDAFLFER